MIERSRSIVILTPIVAVIFAAFLYLQMCTASIYENYQIGISGIRIFHPGLVILLVLLLTIVVPGKVGKGVSSFSLLFSKMAIWICIGLFALYFALLFIPVKSQWSFPHERTLITTIITSLTHPNFSNRSLIGLIYTLILSLILRWTSKRLLIRRHNLSLQPIAKDSVG